MMQPIEIVAKTSRTTDSKKVIIEFDLHLSQQFLQNSNNVRKDIIFLLDRSGSMDSVFPDMMQGVINAINQLTGNNYITIITFDSEAEIICQRLAKADNPTKFKKIKEKLKTLETRGTTATDKGFEKVLEVLKHESIKLQNTTLVFLTDGNPDDLEKAITAIEKITQHFNELMPETHVIGASSSHDADKLLEFKRALHSENYIYVEMEEIKNFFEKHVSTSAGGYIDFEFIDPSTGEKHKNTKRFSFEEEQQFLDRFEIDLDLYNTNIPDLNIEYHAKIKCSEKDITIKKSIRIFKYEIKLDQEMLAKHMINQCYIIYKNENLLKNEKITQLKKLLNYIDIFTNQQTKNDLKIIQVCLDKLDPPKEVQNYQEEISNQALQSLFTLTNNTKNKRIKNIRNQSHSYQQILRSYMPKPEKNRQPNRKPKTNKRQKHDGLKEYHYKNQTCSYNYFCESKIVDRNLDFTDLSYTPQILKLTGPSDLEKIYLNTQQGTLHDFVKKSLGEFKYYKELQKHDIKLVLFKIMNFIAQLFPTKNRSAERVQLLVQNWEDKHDDLPSMGYYIKCKTGAAPQFSVALAYYIGFLVRQNKLPDPNHGVRVFHYRESAFNFKFHSWVMYEYQTKDQPNPQLFLIDPFYYQIFDLTNPNDAKAAINFYESKNLPGLLYNLYRHDNRFLNYNLRQYMPQQLSIPAKALEHVPENKKEKNGEKSVFKTEHYCPISLELMLDPIITLEKINSDECKLILMSRPPNEQERSNKDQIIVVYNETTKKLDVYGTEQEPGEIEDKDCIKAFWNAVASGNNKKSKNGQYLIISLVLQDLDKLFSKHISYLEQHPDIVLGHTYEKVNLEQWKQHCEQSHQKFTSPMTRREIAGKKDNCQTRQELIKLINEHHVPPQNQIEDIKGYSKEYAKKVFEKSVLIQLNRAIDNIKKNHQQLHFEYIPFNAQVFAEHIDSWFTQNPENKELLFEIIKLSCEFIKFLEDKKWSQTNIKLYLQKYKHFLLLTNDIIFEKQRKELKIWSFKNVVESTKKMFPEYKKTTFEKLNNYKKREQIVNITTLQNIIDNQQTDKNLEIIELAFALLDNPISKNSTIKEIQNFLETLEKLHQLENKKFSTCFLPTKKVKSMIDELFIEQYKQLQKKFNQLNSDQLSDLFNWVKLNSILKEIQKLPGARIICVKILPLVTELSCHFSKDFKNTQEINTFYAELQKLQKLLNHPYLRKLNFGLNTDPKQFINKNKQQLISSITKKKLRAKAIRYTLNISIQKINKKIADNQNKNQQKTTGGFFGQAKQYGRNIKYSQAQNKILIDLVKELKKLHSQLTNSDQLSSNSLNKFKDEIIEKIKTHRQQLNDLAVKIRCPDGMEELEKNNKCDEQVTVTNLLSFSTHWYPPKIINIPSNVKIDESAMWNNNQYQIIWCKNILLQGAGTEESVLLYEILQSFSDDKAIDNKINDSTKQEQPSLQFSPKRI